MKFILLLAVAISAAQGLYLQRGLASDLQDFLVLLPVDELRAIYEYYSENDDQVKAIIVYTLSKDIEVAAFDIYMIPEIQDLVEWIIRNLSFDREHNNKVSKQRMSHAPGLNGFVDEVISVLPLEEIFTLVFQKLSEDGAFAQLYHKIQGGQHVYEEIIRTQSVVTVLNNFADLGVDIITLDALIRTAFGWSK